MKAGAGGGGAGNREAGCRPAGSRVGGPFATRPAIGPGQDAGRDAQRAGLEGLIKGLSGRHTAPHAVLPAQVAQRLPAQLAPYPPSTRTSSVRQDGSRRARRASTPRGRALRGRAQGGAGPRLGRSGRTGLSVGALEGNGGGRGPSCRESPLQGVGCGGRQGGGGGAREGVGQGGRDPRAALAPTGTEQSSGLGADGASGPRPRVRAGAGGALPRQCRPAWGNEKIYEKRLKNLRSVPRLRNSGRALQPGGPCSPACRQVRASLLADGAAPARPGNTALRRSHGPRRWHARRGGHPRGGCARRSAGEAPHWQPISARRQDPSQPVRDGRLSPSTAGVESR